MPTAEQTPLRRIASDFADSRIALAGLAMLVLILLAAVFAPLVSPQNPYDLAQLDVMDSRLPPGSASVRIRSVICRSERISFDCVVSISKLSDSPV